jgi:hypothetical protein
MPGFPGRVRMERGVRALDGEILQAGLPPNPTIGGEFEDFGGTGELSNYIESEATLRTPR